MYANAISPLTLTVFTSPASKLATTVSMMLALRPGASMSGCFGSRPPRECVEERMDWASLAAAAPLASLARADTALGLAGGKEPREEPVAALGSGGDDGAELALALGKLDGSEGEGKMMVDRTSALRPRTVPERLAATGAAICESVDATDATAALLASASTSASAASATDCGAMESLKACCWAAPSASAAASRSAAEMGSLGAGGMVKPSASCFGGCETAGVGISAGVEMNPSGSLPLCPGGGPGGGW